MLLSADTVLNTGNDSNGPYFIDEEAEAQTRDVQPAQGLATGVIYACFHGPGPGQGKAGQTRRYKDRASAPEGLTDPEVPWNHKQWRRSLDLPLPELSGWNGAGDKGVIGLLFSTG